MILYHLIFGWICLQVEVESCQHKVIKYLVEAVWREPTRCHKTRKLNNTSFQTAPPADKLNNGKWAQIQQQSGILQRKQLHDVDGQSWAKRGEIEQSNGIPQRKPVQPSKGGFLSGFKSNVQQKLRMQKLLLMQIKIRTPNTNSNKIQMQWKIQINIDGFPQQWFSSASGWGAEIAELRRKMETKQHPRIAELHARSHESSINQHFSL